MSRGIDNEEERERALFWGTKPADTAAAYRNIGGMRMICFAGLALYGNIYAVWGIVMVTAIWRW